jgi:acetyl esterase
VLVLPNQTHGLLSHYGLTPGEAARELLAVDAAGRLYAGAAAVNRALASLGGGWRLLEVLARVPFLFHLEASGYRWVAEHRSRLGFWSARPACEEPNANCE